MTYRTILGAAISIAALSFTLTSNGQTESAETLFRDTALNREDAVTVFIDCARCDINYIRQEIPYVNYVRDVREAQVYILET
jgi:hypothetical protein